MIGIYSEGIASIPFLESFLQDTVILNPTNMNNITQIAGWGRKPSAQKAIEKARKHNLPYLSLEDGFIRSIELGVKSRRTFSLIADPIGIYYDSTAPSQLEEYLNQDIFDEGLINESRECLEYIKMNKISKYNHAQESFTVKKNTKENILMVDQTFNDMSVSLGLADASTFQYMYDYTLEQYPEANIYIKLHPDVIAGKKQGYLAQIASPDRVQFITSSINPIDLLQQMDRVMVVTSQLGFEALMLNKQVCCFGLPFYASWGLTRDQIVCDRREKNRSVEEIFAAAYLRYPKYIRPDTGILGSLMDVLTFINKSKSLGEIQTKYYFHNIPKWKRNFLRPFFDGENTDISFESPKMSLLQRNDSKDNKFVVWSYSNDIKIPQESIVRVEDGFYRSVGLGSNFHEPWSLIIDDIGMYFNPQEPSKLENILNYKEFDDRDIRAAKSIKDFIINNDLTKYNVDYNSNFNIDNINNRKVIFVPGQVEDDASIVYGCTGEIKKLEDLLEHIRKKHPDAFILYKPHPDVVLKNRSGMLKSELYDRIETKASILQCIQIADEVHTLTSQAGFDGLLRGKIVYTYGGPFYAGWGLTIDTQTFSRRKRSLTLEQLIAGTLIYYTKYYNRDLRHQTDCLSTLRKLKEMKKGYSYIDRLLDTNKGRWIRRFKLLTEETLRRDK
ncbi:capsular polysaccharide biosynthesis protein [Paenibacillus campinasensis]|uniref:Capsular polysaccharide biosynthesis protein n=1 Tax=Paenibacillus campinasensis TaxID=66347 RepID=A0ABW9T5I9_9BACL|nr:capsular polysaccharide biosynthesis protein [Paenibacillus campinasensis]MUG68372.1 capsular polysaccharide biosynthesis protein [Paenibacillus campinasensis]